MLPPGAHIHGVPYETWRREYNRGATCKTVRSGNRWTYAEYDLGKSKSSIREGKANMGASMKLTVGMAILFRHFVLELRRSPYDARQSTLETFPGKGVPCLKTFYNHIEAGDMGVFHGQTPYHPGRKRRPRTPAHEVRTAPGRRQIKDRPQEANEAKELGHFEMDTVIFRRGSHGGLLMMLDRCSRRYVIEHLNHVSQDEVVKAIRKMKARKALPVVRSVTTDNGCEFLSQRRLDRVFVAETYLHAGLCVLRERRHRELQPPRQAVVSEGNRLQPPDEARDPAARGLDQRNPQGITERRDCI